jgi:hypothetical protein
MAGTAVKLEAPVPGAAQQLLMMRCRPGTRSKLGGMEWNDPGSAVRRCALHRVREKREDLDTHAAVYRWPTGLA